MKIYGQINIFVLFLTLFDFGQLENNLFRPLFLESHYLSLKNVLTLDDTKPVVFERIRSAYWWLHISLLPLKYRSGYEGNNLHAISDIKLCN